VYDDKQVGKEVAQDVKAQIGVLDDPKLNAYVQGIGKKLLRGVPRRSFQFEFYVVDQYEPNAFALPGGFIFISRGLLTLANDEDELANVIGHEITHSALRHAAAQQEIARRGGRMLSPFVHATNLAAYGRDMERTADKGGQQLAAAAGYDPMGMSTFLRNLGQLERLRTGRNRYQSFFDTHPGSRERAAANAARAREMRWTRDPSLGDTRAAHLRQIDGMALDQRPEAGVFDGDVFIHPDLDFRIRFPRGWRSSNTNQAVGAMAPRGDAVVYLMADLPEGKPETVAQTFLEKANAESPVTVEESGPVKVGRLDAWRLQLREGGSRGHVAATVTLIPYRGATWQVTGVAPSMAAPRYEGRILSTTRSFRPLTESERTSVKVSRLRIVEARPGESLQELSQRTGNGWDVSLTAVENGIFTNHRFKGGEKVKIALVEAYVPKPPAPPKS
jgi:predicted Zn-dependent protease